MQTYTVEVDEYGTTRWYKTGTEERHRVDGPAVECADGHKEWYLDDKLHRVDGPAIECADGGKSWWLEGKQLTEQEWQRKVGSCQGKVVEIDGKKYRLEEI